MGIADIQLNIYLASLVKAPPGPPPRPGLKWKDQTHRWTRPEEKREATYKEGYSTDTFRG